ncbi:MAG TPA: hypothetical protein DDW50_04360 [Firmicutes bacterium]|jgi:single-stranded DNA-binding protein|nr:hypothetical protein [Bacillota bacterium]
MNMVSLVGFLPHELELKASKNGIDMCSFKLCAYSGKSTQLLKCVSFGKIAQNMTKNLQKGALISIGGHLEGYTLEIDGISRLTMEIHVDTVHFL